MADRGAPAGLVLFARRQTAGRGSRGRAFHSPDNGLYFSLLLRPNAHVSDALSITTMAAVAVCHALAGFTQEEPRIKWVNDVYYRNRKISGILTESVTDPDGNVSYLILGIGVDLVKPDGGFPPELEQIAGFVFDSPPNDEIYNCVAAKLLDELDHILFQADPTATREEYRRLSFLIGREVTVREGESSYRAHVTGIGDDYALLLRSEDGRTITLNSGDVSFSQWDGDKQISLSRH